MEILYGSAFNPRCDLGFEDSIRSAKRTIEEQGFAGIKLYPLLGYPPCNNEDQRINKSLNLRYHYCCSPDDGGERQAPFPLAPIAADVPVPIPIYQCPENTPLLADYPLLHTQHRKQLRC